MPYYMVQASYSAAATASMVKRPQDRTAPVKRIITKAGGKLHGLWLAFGEYDVVAIVEMPNNISAAAVSMAIGASGAMSAYRSTPLLTTREAVRAMRKAGSAGYQPPK